MLSEETLNLLEEDRDNKGKRGTEATELDARGNSK